MKEKKWVCCDGDGRKEMEYIEHVELKHKCSPPEAALFFLLASAQAASNYIKKFEERGEPKTKKEGKKDAKKKEERID